jgi:hypothetical protein
MKTEGVNGRHFAARAAWPLWALGILAAVTIVFLDVLDRSRIHSVNDTQPVGIVLGISFSTLGALIVARRPDNRIGWIYLLIGVLTALQAVTIAYYARGVVDPGLPGARWSAWASTWLTFLVFPTGLALFAFLLFPSGRLPSPRWRPLGWLAVAYAAVAMLFAAFQKGTINVGSGLPPTENPVGVSLLGTSSNVVTSASYLVGITIIAGVIGGLLRRGVTSSDVRERQQIKLLAYSAAVTIVALVVLTAAYLAGSGVSDTFWNMPIVIGFGVAVPVACGAAILRHGLYEIDRLISRTVTYAVLTGVLVAVFTGVVLLATQVLPFTSSVGVAASTLTAAALFNPLRRRIQRIVDRRFNRAQYDAQATVAAFGTRLRDAIDGESIGGELLDAVDRALAPAQASIWITWRDRTE